MSQFWTWLATIDTSDEETRRRGHNLIIIALGVIGLAFLFMPMVLLSSETALRSIAILAIAQLISIGAIALGRRGQVSLGALVLLGTVTAAIMASLTRAASLTGPFYLTLSTAVASTLLRPRQIWAATAGITALAALTFSMHSEFYFRQASGIQTLIGATLLLLTVATLGSLGARSVDRSLTIARAESRRALQASRALEEANASLETTVAARTAELEQALGQQQAQAASLQASLAAQRRLDQLVTELSLPIIPVRHDVLVAPLIGQLDPQRAQQLLDNVLREVQQRRASALVLDVTGVPVVDTQTADALLRVARATSLLGAQTILVGIRPEVAQALVTLGVTLDTIGTAATLQEGLALVGSAS